MVISMPFYENGSIQSKMNSLNFVDLKSAIKCVIDVLRGLEYLHESKYYHCDIKPNNILVGNNGEYILTDYGITCFSPTFTAVNPRQTYMPHVAPETVQCGVYDARTDIYELGITAFRLMNGISLVKNDFIKDPDGFRDSVIRGKVITDSMYYPHVPNSVKRIINKAIALDPQKERYQTALEMRRDLERLAFVGNCTADENGNLIAYDKSSRYRYVIEATGKKSYNLTTFRRNMKSGIEKRFLKHCKTNLTGRQINNTLRLFLLEIITGKA